MKNKSIFVDIDGTICSITPGNDYRRAIPYPERILEINKLYDAGHKITYWTARGQCSGKNWEILTETQLETWGAKYHNLILGQKPHFDMYICDKSVNSEDYFNTTYADVDYGFHL
jgi:hydroxymethylpyrimidine pyrophosphatase-like HAD family hydrolase